jgi:membrane protein DedA with SNARE-associated domain
MTLAAWMGQYGYSSLFSLLALGIIGLPVPDETLLTLAGLLVSRGELRFWPTLGSATMGAICGITVSWFLGRSLGIALVRRPSRIIPVDETRLEKTRLWFQRYGKWALMLGYFIPGVRHLVAFVAGSSKLPLSTFAMFAYTGALVWAAAFISSGYYLGSNQQNVRRIVEEHVFMTLSLLVLGVLTYLTWRTWKRRHG